MSGSLECHGVLENWTSIKAYVFGNGESSDQNDEVEWDSNWENDWGDDEEQSKAVNQPTSPKDKKNDENWTQECVIASSPMADVFVIAKGQKAVFLTSEWNVRESTMKYSKLFEGKLSQEKEVITSALCVPLISKKKSSPGGPDWTCIVIGFSDGYVRMYTENGSLLVNQLFHDQPAGSIKCRSYQPATSTMEHDQLEELFVLYKTVLVTIDGFGLFQTLRACRNHLARLQANAAESVMDAPLLSYKKWQYDSDGVGVHDSESVGLQTPSIFDHLFTASIIGGPSARPNKVPFTSTVFATAGDKPYVSFHYAQDGQAVPVFGEIAYAVASKLKSSLLNAATGWLGFGGNIVKQPTQNTKLEPPKIEPATPMAGRFGLPDKQRKGRSVVISPCRKLSAVTDTLGRVVLIDNDRGIAVRMWKGYRDAHCAWLQVDDDMNSKTRVSGRKALFLVIYAPRKGQLEVFAMQQGPRVASFPVSKYGRLLSTPHGMMGLNNIPIKGGNKPSVQCLFLDQEAQLFSLNIPFHLALCDNSNSKLKDMHLLKSLQRLLRESEYSDGDVNTILNDIKTQQMINQAFRILTQSCKKLNVLSKVVESYLENFCEDEQRDLTLVFRIQSLLQLYSYLIKATQLPPPYSPIADGAENTSHDNTVLLCLHASEKEIKLIKDIANKELFNKSSPVKSVSFQDDQEFVSVNEFLNSFSIEFDSAKIKSISNSSENKLQLNKTNDNLPNLGKLLLCGILNNSSDLKEWKSLVKNCELVPSDLLQETLKFWCSNALMSSSYVNLMERLYHVVRTLCELEGSKRIFGNVSETSSWWNKIRKEIAHSSKIFYIYTFAIICRAVSNDLQQDMEAQERKEKTEKNDAAKVDLDKDSKSFQDGLEKMDWNDEDEEGWENVSLDSIKWNVLLKQIEDLSFLSTILAQRPKLTNPPMPILSLTDEELSVVNLSEKGAGCIAELVGRWLTKIGIDPAVIVDKSETQIETAPRPELTDKELKQVRKLEASNEEQKMEIDPEKELEAEASADSEISYILELLGCLKTNFAISLNSSIILANYCWEYCLEWNKDVEEVQYLSAAIACVNVIPSNHIKQGLMSMMWSTFISKQLASLVSRGKIGKDKLLEKVRSIGNSENREMFLRACVKFLDEFMETNVLCESSQPPPRTSSTSKKNHWTTDNASASLTDLALLQPHSNYNMILLHYQLSLSALFLQAFNIKKTSMQSMNLFDTKARMMFFAVMNSPAPYSNVEVDLALKALREEFLCLVVTNAIHRIPEELDNTVEEEDMDPDHLPNIVPSRQGLKECEYWIQKSMELGRTWGIDLDSLKINQVCEYYSSGFDLLGVETIGSVNSKDVLGSKLLVVAGMRLHYVIETNRDGTTEIVSSISTNLSNWLNKLDYSKLRCLRFQKTSITELARQLIHLIPESSYDYNLAEELLSCSSFLT